MARSTSWIAGGSRKRFAVMLHPTAWRHSVLVRIAADVNGDTGLGNSCVQTFAGAACYPTAGNAMIFTWSRERSRHGEKRLPSKRSAPRPSNALPHQIAHRQIDHLIAAAIEHGLERP
jgi:hypothetical protein